MAAGAANVCPKCQAPMKQGFVIDRVQGDGPLAARHVNRWAPGPPEKSFAFGTRLPHGVLPIGTYRCEACGYLESYARPEFAVKGRRQFGLRTLFILMTIVAIALAVIMAFAEHN
jgi:hypothetical protein